ncbi:hypothetical protein ABH926_005968 [Catenulispora sp. GP43]|uniref:hypothetical protein n=1 Tax=Catenulispora sp. GP43 TaxID=3156263 RepID=UPI003512C4EF
MPGAEQFLKEFREQSQQRLDTLDVSPLNGFPEEREPLFSFVNVDDGVRVTLKRPGADVPGISMTFTEPLLQNLATAGFEAWTLDVLALSVAAGEVTLPAPPPAAPTPPTPPTTRSFGNGVPDLAEWLRAPVANIVELTRQAQIKTRLLTDHKSVTITGPTGSGKSTQVRYWAKQCLSRPDRSGLVTLNLIDPHDGPASVVEALLLQPYNTWYLLVIEDIHLNQGNALAIFKLVDRLRKEAGLRISVLATGRVDRMDHMLKPFDVLAAAAKPQTVFDQRLQEYPALTEDQRQQIEALCGNGKDLMLLGYVCGYMDEHELVMPGDAELVQYIGSRLRLDDLTEQSHRDALFHFACMGMFEIDVPSVFAHTVFRDAIEPLRLRNLIEPADTSFRVQSRSIGAHLARYAMLYWGTGQQPVRHPAQVAWDYLVGSGDEAVKAVLDRVWDIVDLGGAAGMVSRRITKSWDRRRELVLSLGKYVDRDPEWGQNAASAAFAAIAMAHLDMAEKWALCGEWVRDKWESGADGELPHYTGGEPTREYEDFVKMRDSMRRAKFPDDFDLDRTHQIWMAAVLLWMESTAPEADRSEARINRLAEAVVAAQDALGFYYPSRVPWMTARVLTSLCEAGEAGGAAARAAANWLVERSQLGWTSGTGKWNTDAMTTAMCLIALRKHAAGANRAKIRAGYVNLDALIQQTSGTLPEIDKALCAEAYLLSSEKHQQEKGYELLETLQDWLHDENVWNDQSQNALINTPQTFEPETESTKLAFVVCQVAACIWQMVKKDLPLMFEDIAQQFRIPKPTAGNTQNGTGTSANPVQPPVPVPDPAAGTVTAQTVDAELLSQARSSIPRVEREITRNIDSREEALRNRSGRTKRIEDQYQEWTARSLRLEQIKIRLAAEPVPRSVIADLDQLAVEAFGDRWRRLL